MVWARQLVIAETMLAMWKGDKVNPTELKQLKDMLKELIDEFIERTDKKLTIRDNVANIIYHLMYSGAHTDNGHVHDLPTYGALGSTKDLCYGTADAVIEYMKLKDITRRDYSYLP